MQTNTAPDAVPNTSSLAATAFDPDQWPYPSVGLRAERRGRRRLQAVGAECEADFSVISLLWTDSAGCYTDVGDSLYEYTVGAVTYVVGAIPLYNSAESPVSFYVGVFMFGNTEGH